MQGKHMKNIVRRITMAAVATLALMPLLFQNSNGFAVQASPTYLNTSTDVPLFPQTSAQKLGLSNFQDTQLIAQSRPLGRIEAIKSKIQVRKNKANLKQAQYTASNQTKLLVYNSSNAQVQCWFGLPQVGDGATSISQLRATSQSGGGNLPFSTLNAQSGFFNLPAGVTAEVTSTVGQNTLRGTIVSFFCAHQCPCGPGLPIPNCSGDRPGVAGPPQPNGVTAGEVTLNPLGANDQEGADISCVNGANAQLRMLYVDGVGRPWNNGDGGDGNVKQIQNSWVRVKQSGATAADDNNCGLSGVFPYGATDCVQLVGPTVCGQQPYCVQNARRCQVQRARLNGNFGGTVTIQFLGPLGPPS